MKLGDFLGLKSGPIGDFLRGGGYSPPLTDSSSSCVSHLHHHEKNHDEEAREISSAAGVAVAAREFFPLAPDLKGLLDTKEVGDPRQEAVPAQPKRKSPASLTDDGTPVVEQAAKRCRSQKGKKGASQRKSEEERRNGVSTELVLRYDPYKIKKKLQKSDLGDLSRLLLPRAGLKIHVLPVMSEERVSRVESGEGADVTVWDTDTRTEHRLVFVLWASARSYVLKGGWIKEFVRRRGLAEGDEVGIYWDQVASRFHFSLLRRAS